MFAFGGKRGSQVALSYITPLDREAALKQTEVRLRSYIDLSNVLDTPLSRDLSSPCPKTAIMRSYLIFVCVNETYMNSAARGTGETQGLLKTSFGE